MKLLIGIAAAALSLGITSAIAAQDDSNRVTSQSTAQQDAPKADDARRNRDSTLQGQDPSMQPGSSSQPSASDNASAGNNSDTVKSMEPDTTNQLGTQEDALRNRDSTKQHDRDDSNPPHQ